jgi:DNA-binding response OmpR family regulator
MDLVVGLDDFFVKPLGVGRLVARVQQIVQTRSGVRSRVLLVDDDAAVHEELQRRLVEEGYRVDHAQSAELGIARASATPPALVVVDLRLGGWDGVRTVVRLRGLAKTASMPMIALTAPELTDPDRASLEARVAELADEAEADRQTLVDTVRMLLARGRG